MTARAAEHLVEHSSADSASAMRLFLYAVVQGEPPWIGTREVERGYSRVPAAGESVRLGDRGDSRMWPVSHVSWDNAGDVMLTLGFDAEDQEMYGVGPAALESYGFRRLVGERPPVD
jgi:hypothetical protein